MLVAGPAFWKAAPSGPESNPADPAWKKTKQETSLALNKSRTTAHPIHTGGNLYKPFRKTRSGALSPATSGIRLADMQKREPTCKKGCPRCKTTSGKCCQLTGENGGSTFRFRYPRCKNCRPTGENGGSTFRFRYARCKNCRSTGENGGSTFRFRYSRCKTLCLEPNGNEIVK